MRVALVALAVLLISVPAVAVDRYAVSLVKNTTTVPIRISWAFGGVRWQSQVLQPKKTAVLSFRFARPDVALCPPLTLRISTDRSRPAASLRAFRLDTRACPDRKGSCGRRYVLKFGDEKRYIELYDPE